MRDLDHALRSFLAQYGKDEIPIEVDFRKLVSWIPYQADRATHLCHSYPAKLLLHIPYFFLQNATLSKPGDAVLDPFCGSGTVLVEALLSGRHAIGADCNPLARLITKVKTHHIPPEKIRRSVRSLTRRLGAAGPSTPSDVVNLRYWFYPHVIIQLSKLRDAIFHCSSERMRDFFLVCLSQCVRRVSLADPRVSVPVRLRRDQYPPCHRLTPTVHARLASLRRVDVASIFLDTVEANLRRINSLSTADAHGLTARVEYDDARYLRGAEGVSPISSRSVQLIITSPPYVGAQKYVRSTSLNMGWLGLCRSDELRCHERQTIGREHYSSREYEILPDTTIPHANTVLRRIRRENPLRAHIAANYLVEMNSAFKEASRVLRVSGYMILIAANNSVCGIEFLTQRYLAEIARSHGLIVKLQLIDGIKSRGLMTKRNKTASLITREWITLFKKESK